MCSMTKMAWIAAIGVALGSSGIYAADSQVEFDPEMLEASGVGPPVHHWVAESPAGRGGGPVTAEQLAGAHESASDWLHYGGGYNSWRHSPIEAITAENVATLQPVWVFSTGAVGPLEASPIVYDGVLYLTGSFNRLFALDAATGTVLWRYDHQPPDDLRLCCGPPNRGVAISGDLVLMATLDARLIAFDRKTGAIVWNVEIDDYRKGLSATAAPLVVEDKVVIGIAGGEYGIRGFLDAYEVKTGKRVWRRYTVPAQGEPGSETWAGTSYETGGAPTWTTGSYDPKTRTLFWATGNPSPDFDGSVRAGDNLYSDSVLALDIDSGSLRWYFQFTPHDVWDYDGNSDLLLVDVLVEGKLVRGLGQPNRNGFFYLLNRDTGEFLNGAPYVEVNWATLDAKGRPMVADVKRPAEEPIERVCPGNMGGKNGAWTAAYSPLTGLAYVPSIESCQYFLRGESIHIEGAPYYGGTPVMLDAAEGKAYGHLTAWDVAKGEVRWRYRDAEPMMGGVLSMAGGVVFTGNLAGHALALDAETGELLWKFQMGSGVRSQPVAWQQDGRTYVAIGAGHFSALTVFTGGVSIVPEASNLFVFALPEPGVTPVPSPGR
jgi:alcohol dehydrogenase (cytochrome c)